MMSDNESLVLELLRRIRATQEATRQDVSEMKAQLESVERQLAEVQAQAEVMGSRLERLERQFGVGGAETASEPMPSYATLPGGRAAAAPNVN